MRSVTSSVLFLVVVVCCCASLVDAGTREKMFNSLYATDTGQYYHMPTRAGLRPLYGVSRVSLGTRFHATICAVGVFTNKHRKEIRELASKFERGDRVKVVYHGRGRFNILAIETQAHRRIVDELRHEQQAEEEEEKKPRRNSRRSRRFRGALTWHSFGLRGPGLLAELAQGKSLKGNVVNPERLASFGRPFRSGDPTTMGPGTSWRKGEPVFVSHLRDHRLRIKSISRNQALTLILQVKGWEKAPRRRGPRKIEKLVDGRIEVTLSAEQQEEVAGSEKYRYRSVEPTAEQRRRLMKIFRQWKGDWLQVKSPHVRGGGLVWLAADDDLVLSRP